MSQGGIDETEEQSGDSAATPGDGGSSAGSTPPSPVGSETPGAVADLPLWKRVTRRDLAIGAGLAIMLALSPLTPNEWAISFAIGLAVAALFVGYRAYGRTSSTEPRLAGAGAATAASSQGEIHWLVWATLAGWIIAFAPTFQWMYVQWTTSVWQNNHGIFVPVLMWLLARSALKRDSGAPDTPSLWGYVLLGIGLGLALVDSASNTRYLAAIGVVISIPGIALLILGRRRTRASGAAWLMGVFMIPLPTMAFHHVFLRNFTAASITPVLQWLGLATLREQSVLTLPQGLFVVGDACSGFATLYSAFAVGVFLACFSRSPWRRVLLIASFVPLALAANVLRALVLILIAIFLDKDLLDTALHEASGVASFFLVLVVLYRLCDRERLQEAFA